MCFGRFLGKDIITIREAAWLTDNTYKYEDVVRMMGEITATLKGNIRIPNSLDFVEIFCSVAGLDKKCSSLAEYICELTLLQAEMGQYSPAEIAASCVLLARLLMKLGMSLFHYSFITCNFNVFGLIIQFSKNKFRRKKKMCSIHKLDENVWYMYLCFTCFSSRSIF